MEALKAKKNQLTEEIIAVNLKLNKVNTAIEKMMVNEKRLLITALAIKAINFEHAIEIQANIKTRQNLELYPEFGGKLIRVFIKEGQLVKKGSLNRSIIGAHKKLKAYTPKISPAQPIVLLLRPSSFNHRESALAINTQGKPLIIPKRRILIILLS